MVHEYQLRSDEPPTVVLGALVHERLDQEPQVVGANGANEMMLRYGLDRCGGMVVYFVTSVALKGHGVSQRKD